MVPAWDAIVIGSGMGGMSAAGLLAKVAGMKVLVLEKHSERGGQTHVFRRDGASWDVGLHYLGELQPGSFIRNLFDFLSDGALGWNRMPDDFERFVYPGFAFAVPSDPRRYQARLIERFPAEADAIRRYFRDLSAVARWHILGVQQQMAPAPIAFLLAQARRFGGARATQTTDTYLERHFRSRELKALLATQWGDYGLPPKQSAFALHALVVGSYLNGGWFPEGGAGRIARTIEPAIEAAGGSILARKRPQSSSRTAAPWACRRSIGAAASRSRSPTALLSSSPTSARRSPTSDCCRPTARSGGAPLDSARPSRR
jgi:phytoene dehydrogenase-like protein